MQQKQNKSEATSKNTGNFAKMMLQRDKNRLKEQQKHASIELLKEPRGKEYFRLLEEVSGLCENLTEVEDEITQLEAELEQAAVTISSSDVMKVIDRPKEESSDEGEIKVTWKSQPVQDVPKIQTAGVKAFKEKQKRLAERKQKREEMAEQLRTAMHEFEAQLPAPDKLIGMVWPDMNTDILIRYGVIPCPGFAYTSPEELLEQVQPSSEQEERQWLKGNEAAHTYWDNELLIVEIYMEAVCVVFKDGHTIVIE